MPVPSTRPGGHILGHARAEADGDMLKRAFVETVDLQALLNSTTFNYVVGRRGTGKSALFNKLREQFPNDGALVAPLRVDEAAAMSLRERIARLVSKADEQDRYPLARAIC